MLYSFSLILFSLISLPACIAGFTYSFTEPTQCDPLTVSWTGGSPPFQLLLSPTFGTPLNFSIPDAAFQNGKGTYTTTLPFPESHTFLITMSDSSGFGSGGTSNVLRPGPSTGGKCNTTDPGPSFFYDINDALTQCRNYTFTGYFAAIQPVTIIGLVPGGTPFQLKPPVGPTSFQWTANVYNGTSILFLLIDSQSRQGGTSDVLTVASSGDTSCIDVATVPSTTANPPSGPTKSSSPSSGTNAGVIAGGVIGALIFLAVFITLGLFYLRHWREKSNTRNPNGDRRSAVQAPLSYSPYSDPMGLSPSNTSSLQPARRRSGEILSPLSESRDQSSFTDATSPSDYSQSTAALINPFIPTDAERNSSYRLSTSASSSTQKYGSQPPRFLMHTDLEDAVPESPTESVVELPPQYKERPSFPPPAPSK